MPTGVYDRTHLKGKIRYQEYKNRTHNKPTKHHVDMENEKLRIGDEVYTLGHKKNCQTNRACVMRKGHVTGFIGDKCVLVDFGDYEMRKRCSVVLKYNRIFRCEI